MKTPAIIDHQALIDRILSAERDTFLEFGGYFQSVQRLMAKMITTGKVIAEAKSALRGRFLEWIEVHHDSNPIFPTARTCQRRMALLRYEYLTKIPMKEVAENHHAEWDIACRIMQIHPSGNGERDALPPDPCPFRLTFGLTATDPSKWSDDYRKEFLEKAKPVVELYERVVAA